MIGRATPATANVVMNATAAVLEKMGNATDGIIPDHVSHLTGDLSNTLNATTITNHTVINK